MCVSVVCVCQCVCVWGGGGCKARWMGFGVYASLAVCTAAECRTSAASVRGGIMGRY